MPHSPRSYQWQYTLSSITIGKCGHESKSRKVLIKCVSKTFYRCSMRQQHPCLSCKEELRRRCHCAFNMSYIKRSPFSPQICLRCRMRNESSWYPLYPNGYRGLVGVMAVGVLSSKGSVAVSLPRSAAAWRRHAGRPLPLVVHRGVGRCRRPVPSLDPWQHIVTQHMQNGRHVIDGAARNQALLWTDSVPSSPTLGAGLQPGRRRRGRAAWLTPCRYSHRNC